MNHIQLKKYQHGHPLLIAVDCIIFGVEENYLKLLVFEREVEPFAGQWSLLGSFVEPGESVSEAAERILFELTGLQDIYMEQLHCFGEVERDPGDRVVSVAHWSLIRVDQNHLEFNMSDHKARWVRFDEVPDLVLDHKDMVMMAIERLQERARFHPVGFELLPDEFTLPQLLKVYEAIFAREIDDRNFRKKLINSGLLTRLPKKDMTTSKKGSYLYKFNQTTYKQLSRDGYNFGF